MKKIMIRMNKVLLITAMLTASCAIASPHIANDIAKKDINIFAVSYNSVTTSVENVSTKSSFQQYQASYRFLLEYGVSHHNSIGVYTTKTIINNKEDFGDISFYLKEYNKGFLYQITGHISPERSGNENADSGGEHLTIKLGYELNDFFGVDISYSPDYSYKITDLEDETKYRRGSSKKSASIMKYHQGKTTMESTYHTL
jgi:hypothetical protein